MSMPSSLITFAVARLCRLRVVVFCAVVAACLGPAASQSSAQFQDMVRHVPKGANAIMILNVDNILASPMGVREGWKANLEKAFAAGMIRVPPKANRFVLASQIDFEFMKPNWEAALAEAKRVPWMSKIAKEYEGTLDKIGETEAVVLPNDTYVVLLRKGTLGAMAPANRQAVANWLADLDLGVKLSDYLKKAAEYSDTAGTEIIIALDLAKAFAPSRIDRYLKTKKWLDEMKVDRTALDGILANLKGMRVGIRIGEVPFGKLSVDFSDTVSLSPEIAKRLLLEIIADGGMMIEDLDAWKPEVDGMTLSISGNLSAPGLRKILSVVESPAPAGKSADADEKEPSPGELAARCGQDTLRYFKTIDSFYKDLQQDLRDARSLSHTKVWFNKYAKKIERMPILNIDPEMLDYGAFVAKGLRAASGSMTSMGINSAARQADIQGSSGNNAYNYGGYGVDRGGYGYGAAAGFNAVAGAYAGLRDEAHQRHVVRAEERSIAAMDCQQIKAVLVDATNNIRRKMTEKYKIEF